MLTPKIQINQSVDLRECFREERGVGMDLRTSRCVIPENRSSLNFSASKSLIYSTRISVRSLFRRNYKRKKITYI
jgi:hypothetical protein